MRPRSLATLPLLTASALVLLAAAGAASPALASAIEYVAQGTGSGSFDGQPFEDTAFILTFHGDSDNVTRSGSVFFNATAVFAPTLWLDGFGLFDVTTQIKVFGNPVPTRVGFMRASNSLDIFNIDAPEFATYDLVAAIGPIVSGAGVVDSQGGFATSGGTIAFTGFSGARTWTTSVVPEPGTALLLGVGLAFVPARRARRGPGSR